MRVVAEYAGHADCLMNIVFIARELKMTTAAQSLFRLFQEIFLICCVCIVTLQAGRAIFYQGFVSGYNLMPIFGAFNPFFEVLMASVAKLLDIRRNQLRLAAHGRGMARIALPLSKRTVRKFRKPFRRIRGVGFMATGTPGLCKELIFVHNRQILLPGFVTLQTEAGLVCFQVVSGELVTVAGRGDFAAIQVAGKAALFERFVLKLLLQGYGNMVVAFEADRINGCHL